MPRPKSLKTLFLETILFISLFAMVGHLSVNFWERYVIQTELSKMKTSLHSLKETINHIGIAYDNLHKELKDLAEIAEKNPVKQVIQRKAPDKPERKSQSNLAQAILQDIQLQAAMATHEMKIGAVPSTDNQNTQKSLHEYKIDKNATTWTKTLTQKFNEGKDASTLSDVYKVNNVDKKVGPEYLVQHKTTQDVSHRSAHSKVAPPKNASTITRYPLKSTATGLEKRKSQNKYVISSYYTQNNKCGKDDNSTLWNFWKSYNNI